jgi:DNA-binding Lrp family transcriptional regulator
MSNVLEPLGLDVTAEQLYFELIRSPRIDRHELAGRANISEDECARLVTTLESRGLVTRALSQNGERIIPVPPDLAIEALVHRREEELERLRILGRHLADEFRHALQARSPEELVEIVVGREAVVQRIDQLHASLRVDLMMIDTPPYRSADGPAFDPREVDALNSGLTYRVIYHRPALDLPGYLEQILTYVAHGEEARVLPRAPMKLSVFDRRAAALPLNPAQLQMETVVIVHESPLLDAIVLAFESMWQRAVPLVPDKPLPEEEARVDSQLDATDRRLLTLLAAGFKDSAIARQLGLSDRTIRRHIESLLSHLDASTRFQAGMQAALRGWLKT